MNVQAIMIEMAKTLRGARVADFVTRTSVALTCEMSDRPSWVADLFVGQKEGYKHRWTGRGETPELALRAAAGAMLDEFNAPLEREREREGARAARELIGHVASGT